MKPIAYFQHQRAQHDPNGNPQRLFVCYDRNGNIIRVFNEGYSGHPRELRGVNELASVDITKSSYHDTIRFAKDKNILS